MPSVAEFVAYLERFAPLALAADWDNVGLLLGDPTSSAERVLTCLTITPDVVTEAVAEKVGLIVAHHPILFKGAKRLTTATPEGQLLLPLFRAGIAVYSPHTAFDNCPGGINDGLATRLSLTNICPLRAKESRRECKLVVFVPDADLDKVSDAIFNAGGGVIGQYRECSFRLAGTGTFFGTEATNPAVGQKGRRESVNEWRLEVVVPEARITGVIAAVRSAHSYEEPAFDVYPLRPMSSGGEGRIGELPAPMSLQAFATLVKQALHAATVQFVGPVTKPVQRVAIACGAAGEFLTDAKRATADVFLTGEVRFHDCLSAEQSGIGIVLPGHYATERPGIEDLAVRLQSEFPDATIWASRRECEPLRVV